MSSPLCPLPILSTPAPPPPHTYTSHLPLLIKGLDGRRRCSSDDGLRADGQALCIPEQGGSNIERVEETGHDASGEHEQLPPAVVGQPPRESKEIKHARSQGRSKWLHSQPIQGVRAQCAQVATQDSGAMVPTGRGSSSRLRSVIHNELIKDLPWPLAPPIPA